MLQEKLKSQRGKMSRTSKSIKNSKLNFTFVVATILLSFISRKIFIEYLGDNIVGLTSTMQNILGLLNIAESGISVSISFALYEPLFKNDRQRIKEIISILLSLYKKIGIIILGLSVCLLITIPFIFKNSEVPITYIYTAFIVFLTSNLIGYFLNFRQILLVANQQGYIVVSISKLCIIIKVICQIFALKYLESGYIVWLFIELLFSFCNCYLLNLRINKLFPWLMMSELKQEISIEKYSFIFKKIKQVFFHRTAGILLVQTGALFIYIFTDFATVTKYTNYTLIATQITIVFGSLLNSTSASIGNLVAEGNKNNSIKIFGELLSIRFVAANIVIFCMYNLTEPFIGMWFGTEYILDRTILILILSSTFISLARGCVDSFVDAYGLFHDVWATCVEAIIFIAISIIGGYYWGIKGIALAPVVANGIFVVFWKPYFLFKNGFKMQVSEYWKKIIKLLLFNGLLFVACHYFIQKWAFEINSLFQFFIYALGLFSVYSIFSFSISYLTTRSIRDFTFHIVKMIKASKNKM